MSHFLVRAEQGISLRIRGQLGCEAVGFGRKGTVGRQDTKGLLMDEMKKAIIDYIRKEYVEDEETEITESTPLLSGGIVDSFSMVSLKAFLEKKFGVQIPDAKVTPETFDTVNSIAALVEELRG